MLVYNYDSNTGSFTGMSVADPSPLEPGVWLIPACATSIAPPDFNSTTQTCRWNGDEWIVADIVIDEPEEPEPPTVEERIALLQATYDSDLQQLQRAWLAALIADGAGEAARQAAIKQQMADLEAQLEIDIMAIFEEV